MKHEHDRHTDVLEASRPMFWLPAEKLYADVNVDVSRTA